MLFGGIIGLRKTENALGAKSERFSGAPHAKNREIPLRFLREAEGDF